MQKIISSFLIALLLAFPAAPLAYAGGLPVFDAANFGVNTITSGASVSSGAADPITSVQQTLDTVNKTILIPMRDALTIIQILQNSQMITALITGALGSEALLVTNPELYLKNKAIAVTQGGIDVLARQNNVFGNSIIASIVKNTRNNSSSLTFQLNNINKSSIPTIQQNKICSNDAELSALARADSNATGADYTARKTELYNSFCRCNPNAETDEGKACARRLTTLSNRQPSLDTFYAITQGDNAYTKAQLSQLAIAQDAERKKEQAKADLAQGGGIKSKTTCTKFASNGGCIEHTIQQAASILNNSYTQALNSGLNTAISSFGSGAGSLIGTIFTTISLVQGISTGIGSISGGGNTGSGNTTSRPTTTSTPTTNNQTQTSTSGYTQDLVNNPQTRTTLSNAPMDQLNYHKAALQELTSTDNSFMGALDSFDGQLNALEACFNNLQIYDEAKSDPYLSRITAGKNYVTNAKAANAAKRTAIQTELTKIGTATALINTTISTIQNSNSTQQITDTFQNYQNQVRSQSLPDLTSNVTRQGEFATFSGNVMVTTSEGGQYANYKKDCETTIPQQIIQSRGHVGAGM